MYLLMIEFPRELRIVPYDLPNIFRIRFPFLPQPQLILLPVRSHRGLHTLIILRFPAMGIFAILTIFGFPCIRPLETDVLRSPSLFGFDSAVL